MSRIRPVLLAALLLTLVRGLAWGEGNKPLRVGHFPNLTHAQALVGRSFGTFEKQTGMKIDWKVFNAGPSEMEALIAGKLDIAYVGPNPAVNAYLRSKGSSLRIVAGAATGGAALVIPATSRVRTAADFKGKRIASPELGNTQDVALRHWLTSNGLNPRRDVQVIPMKNPDILMLFQQGKLDGAWVPEPWVARLLREGNGKVFLNEANQWPQGKFPTAVLVVQKNFLEKNRETVRRFLDAHVEVTQWIGKHPDEARKRINAQLQQLTGKAMPVQTLSDAFSRVAITYDPAKGALVTTARRAQVLGYLPRNTDLASGLAGLFDFSLTNDVLKKRRLAPVREK